MNRRESETGQPGRVADIAPGAVDRRLREMQLACARCRRQLNRVRTRRHASMK
jgi:hypothetical protein